MASTLERRERRLREDGFSRWRHKRTGDVVWVRAHPSISRFLQTSGMRNRYDHEQVDAVWFAEYYERVAE